MTQGLSLNLELGGELTSPREEALGKGRGGGWDEGEEEKERKRKRREEKGRRWRKRMEREKEREEGETEKRGEMVGDEQGLRANSYFWSLTHCPSQR